MYGSFGPRGSRAEGTLELPPHCARVAKMVLARRYWAYGPQSTYFDEPRCVGFTRHGRGGQEEDPSSRCGRGRGHGRGRDGPGSGLAVVLSTAAAGASSHHQNHHQDGGRATATKRMYVGVQHAGERWTDVLRGPQQGECHGEEGGIEPEEKEQEVVVIDDQGWGTFWADPRSVAVWVDVAAEARDVVDGFEL